ncbi:unnamed protein product [Closterium sp. Yama58-4]|nr:unnamed protein product [Closterium sp. Yama58-4]
MAENQFHSTRYTSWCPAPRSADNAVEQCPTAGGFDPLIFEEDDEGELGYSYEDNVAAYVESLDHAHENQWTELEASCELLDQAGVAIEEICLTHGMPSALISVSAIPEVDETSEQFHDAPAASASSNASTPRRDDSPVLFSKFSRTPPASGAGVPVIRMSRFGDGMKHSASVPALDSLASNGSGSDLIPNQVYYVSNQSLNSFPATVNDGNNRTACMKHSVSVPALNHLAIYEHLPSVGQLIQPVSSTRRLISQPSNVSLQSNDSNGYFDDRDPTILRRMPTAALSAVNGAAAVRAIAIPQVAHCSGSFKNCNVYPHFLSRRTHPEFILIVHQSVKTGAMPPTAGVAAHPPHAYRAWIPPPAPITPVTATHPQHFHPSRAYFESHADPSAEQFAEERALAEDRARAASKVGQWVDAHFSVPPAATDGAISGHGTENYPFPCEPEVGEEGGEMNGEDGSKNGRRRSSLEDEALERKLAAVEMENCEMTGRVAGLEAMLRERERETADMRRQIFAYTQALEAGRGDSLTRAELINHVVQLTNQVQELAQERDALRNAPNGIALTYGLRTPGAVAGGGAGALTGALPTVSRVGSMPLPVVQSASSISGRTASNDGGSLVRAGSVPGSVGGLEVARSGGAGGGRAGGMGGIGGVGPMKAMPANPFERPNVSHYSQALVSYTPPPPSIAAAAAAAAAVTTEEYPPSRLSLAITPATPPPIQLVPPMPGAMPAAPLPSAIQGLTRGTVTVSGSSSSGGGFSGGSGEQCEKAIKQLEMLLKTGRVSRADILAGVHEKCTVLLEQIVPPSRSNSLVRLISKGISHATSTTISTPPTEELFQSDPSSCLIGSLLSAIVTLSWSPSSCFFDISIKPVTNITVRRLLLIDFLNAVFWRGGKACVIAAVEGLGGVRRVDKWIGVREESLPSSQELAGCKVLVMINTKAGAQYKRKWVFGK